MKSLHPRAKKDLLAMGYAHVETTEHWVAFPRGGGIRRDLMGWADLLALGLLDSGRNIVGVQVTSWNNMSTRRKKISSSDIARTWWLAGGGCLLMGYKKNKSGRYEHKVEWVGW